MIPVIPFSSNMSWLSQSLKSPLFSIFPGLPCANRFSLESNWIAILCDTSSCDLLYCIDNSLIMGHLRKHSNWRSSRDFHAKIKHSYRDRSCRRYAYQIKGTDSSEIVYSYLGQYLKYMPFTPSLLFPTLRRANPEHPHSGFAYTNLTMPFRSCNPAPNPGGFLQYNPIIKEFPAAHKHRT